MVLLMTFSPENNRHYITLFMISESFEGEPQLLEPDKCARWDWFELNALPEPLFRPIQTLITQERLGDGMPQQLWSLE